MTLIETATGWTRVLHFRDRRPPDEVQFALERTLMSLFTPLMDDGQLRMHAPRIAAARFSHLPMTRFLIIVGWLLVAIDLVAAAVLLLGPPSGDAATRAIGPGFGALLLCVGAIAAGLLLWGGQGAGRPGVLVIASVLAVAPVALTLVFVAPSQRIRGWIYPSMRDDRPRLPSPQYAYPDAASREAALALVMQDYAKLDTLLRARLAPDLTAHDELGQSLMGLATSAASMDGGDMRDVEGLRLLLAAGGRPRADDMGTGRDKSLMELLALSEGERGRTVLAAWLRLTHRICSRARAQGTRVSTHGRRSGQRVIQVIHGIGAEVSSATLEDASR